MKKLLVLVFLLLFAFQGIGLAAKSSSPSHSSSAPKMTTTQKASNNGYKPSAPANSYNQKAPESKATNPATVQQPSSSGGFMRGLGLFGGGMLLGSLLGGSFGFGPTGGFATMAGMLFNLLFIACVIMAIRFLWDKFKNRKQNDIR